MDEKINRRICKYINKWKKKKINKQNRLKNFF